MADGVISKEEYMVFRAGYDRKIQARQQSLSQLKEEREQAVESNQRRDKINQVYFCVRADFIHYMTYFKKMIGTNMK